MKQVILPLVDKTTTIEVDSLTHDFSIYASLTTNSGNVSILHQVGTTYYWVYTTKESNLCEGNTLQEVIKHALQANRKVYQFTSYTDFANWLINKDN